MARTVTVTWTDPETDIEYDLDFEVTGRYIPANRLEPAEWPDAEWDGKVEDADGNEVEDPEVLERIETALPELEEEALEHWSEHR